MVVRLSPSLTCAMSGNVHQSHLVIIYWRGAEILMQINDETVFPALP